MAMTIELARFTVDDDAVTQLVAGRPAMIRALQERFPGCLAAYLTREDDGSWLDVVLWRSRAEAEEAATLVNSVPVCAAWFRHIAKSGGLRHVEVVAAWPAVGLPPPPDRAGKHFRPLGLVLRRVIAGYVSVAAAVLRRLLSVVSGMIAVCDRCAAGRCARGSA